MKPINSFTLTGDHSLEARIVTIDCVVDPHSLGRFAVRSGSREALPSVRAKEIAIRTRSAMHATNAAVWPAGAITINIDAGKPSAAPIACVLDLPIACALIGADVDGLLVAGELGLNGDVRGIRGVVQATLLAKRLGMRGVLVPAANALDALDVADGLDVYEIGNLRELGRLAPTTDRVTSRHASTRRIDFSEVRGQTSVIAAVERAVSTNADMLLSGPPGAGKTMIARRIPSILPTMTRDEQIAVSCAYSACGLSSGLLTERPFRAPHHTISTAALVGGVMRRPGELQLAMCGVLFLDELVEFSRDAIESLVSALAKMLADRRPLIVAAANPCSCGWRGTDVRACVCKQDSVDHYAARLRAFTDALGLYTKIEINTPSLGALRDAPPCEPSAAIAARVAASKAAEVK